MRKGRGMGATEEGVGKGRGVGAAHEIGSNTDPAIDNQNMSVCNQIVLLK